MENRCVGRKQRPVEKIVRLPDGKNSVPLFGLYYTQTVTYQGYMIVTAVVVNCSIYDCFGP